MNQRSNQNQKEMLVKKLLLPFAALCLLAGCARELPPVSTYYDLSGQRTDLLDGNMLPSPVNPPREIVWLNAFRAFKSSNSTIYYLEVDYMAKTETGFLNIPYGETLTLILDGQPIKLFSGGSFNLRKEKDNGLVEEKAIYEVTREQLQMIANSRKVEVQIKGDNGLVIREFDEGNHKKFRLFVMTYAG